MHRIPSLCLQELLAFLLPRFAGSCTDYATRQMSFAIESAQSSDVYSQKHNRCGSVLVLMCSLIPLRCGALCLSNTVRISLPHRALYIVCDRQLVCGALFQTACSHCACFVCVRITCLQAPSSSQVSRHSTLCSWRTLI